MRGLKDADESVTASSLTQLSSIFDHSNALVWDFLFKRNNIIDSYRYSTCGHWKYKNSWDIKREISPRPVLK